MFRSVALLLGAVGLASAHNWVSSPARADNNFNAYQQPPCPPKGSKIHIQVGLGQLFPFEFATGHGTPDRGGTYVTIIKAKDEAMLKRHTRALLDEYIKDGPPGYMAGHHSHHVGSPAGSTDQIVTDNVAFNMREGWKANKPPKGSAIYSKKPNAVTEDARASYLNPKYPWIVSAGRFKIHEDKSEEADIVEIEIPQSAGSGQYVVQYMWNGYYDCMDVNAINEESTDLYGRDAGGVQYDRIDHCLYNPTYEGYTVLGSCVELKDGEGIGACQSKCNSEACTALQVTPVTLGADARFNGIFGGSHLPPECAGFDPTSFACYAVTAGEPIIGAPYFITSDPEDPHFYSSCFKRAPSWTFDQPCPACNGGSDVPPAFKFGKKCITCNDLEHNKNKAVVPRWELTDKCTHCDKSLG